MHANLIKSIWIVVIIAAILSFVGSPALSAASMEMTDENCGCSAGQEETAIPLCCCLTSDCPLSLCISPKAVACEVLLPNRFTGNEDVSLAWSAPGVTPETSLNPKKPFQRDPTQGSPSRLYTEYHCRDCLNSEESPQG